MGDKIVDEKELQRREIARKKLLDGSISAVTIDTNIFTAAGYSLEYGNFKQLEQFKDDKFNLIFSDVILMEVLDHLVKNSDLAKTSLLSSIREARKSWGFEKGKNQVILDDLMGKGTSEVIAEDRIKKFKERTDFQLVDSKLMLDVTELLMRYFKVLPPFEGVKDKKTEFPDAIALITLNKWATEENKEVLVVTKDNGWHRFCEEGNNLFSVNDLGEALTLIQERNIHSSSICSKISSLIAAGKYPLLLGLIEDSIADDIWSIDWEHNASSSYYFDYELQGVEVITADFERDGNLIELQAVDYRSGQLVARANIHLEIESECDFNFGMKDGIDRDMVPMGSALVTRRNVVEVDVLLTFENLTNNIPTFVGSELVPSFCYVDFGFVEPDYGNQDPYDERY